MGECMNTECRINREARKKLLSIMVEERVKELGVNRTNIESVVNKLSKAGYKTPEIKAILKIYGSPSCFRLRRPHS